MPYRVIAPDGVKVAVLLRLAQEYDEHATPVDATSFQVTNIKYWFYVALTQHNATIEPPYIWGTNVRHVRTKRSL